MNNINTKTLKASLSVDDHKAICQALGIPVYLETPTEVRYWSGDKNVDPLQGSPGKLIHYKDTGVYIGYTSSQSYDIIALVQRRLGLLKQPCSFIDSVNFILATLGRSLDSAQRLTKRHVYNWEDELGKFIRFRRTGSTLPSYDTRIISQLTKSWPLDWLEEGIGPLTLSKYQIGYYDRSNQTTIPVYGKDGLLHGIRVRNWDPEAEAKYMPLILADGTCYKFDTNQLLYGLNYNWPEIERTGVVMIGESEKFVMKMDTWFQEKSVAVGMFGGSLGLKRRNDLIKLGVNRVVLVPDNDWIGKDEAAIQDWQRKIQKQVDLWAGYAQVEVVWDKLNLLNPKDNATDMDKETWDRLYEARDIC